VYCKKNYGIDNVYVSGGKRGWVKLNKKIQHFDNAVLIGYDLITN
jgi:hypothetical protein